MKVLFVLDHPYGEARRRRASPITVMSTPSFVYRWILGNPLPKVMFRETFRKIGVNSCVGSAPSTPQARRSRRVSVSSKRPRRGSRPFS